MEYTNTIRKLKKTMKESVEPDTYFIGDNEYTKCCDYGVVLIKNKKGEKIRMCNQCLKKLKPETIKK